MIDFVESWWPPDEDRTRLEDYKRRQDLFESKHAEAFKEKSGKLPTHLKDKLYLVQDYPRLISVAFADLLFGQSPIFSLPGQQPQLDKLVADNRLSTALYESELSASFRGDAVFKVSIGPRHAGGPNEVLIEEVPAYTYFVELDPDNTRRVKSQCLAWERKVVRKMPGGDTKEITYLRVEEHGPGWIKNALFEVKGFTKVVGPLPLSDLYGDDPDQPKPYEDTGVPVPLLFHFPNTRHGSCFYGESDYTMGLESLFDEADQRITSMASVLDKHVDPMTVIPTGIINKRGGTVNVEDLHVIEIPPEFEHQSNLPRKVTWDPLMESSFRELETIENQIFLFSDVCRLDRKVVGHIDSGRAMHMLMAPMLARGSRKQTYRQPVICEMLHTALWLGAANQVSGYTVPTALPEMVWRNGLPKDDKELMEVASTGKGAGIMSQEDAIRYFFQIGQQEARAIMARIKSEEPDDPAGGPGPIPEPPPSPAPQPDGNTVDQQSSAA